MVWCFVELILNWWKVMYDEASTVGDHKDTVSKVGGFNPLTCNYWSSLLSHFLITSQKQTMLGFCVFTDWSATLKTVIEKQGNKKKFLIHVWVTDKNGRLIFNAKYGNCYKGSNPNTAHAEYLMLVDEDFRQAVKFLRDRMEGNITMDMNKQPCSVSTSHGRKTALKVKNCAQELINFFDVYCSTGSIKLHIYLCQLYKVDMDVPHEISLAQEKCSTGPKNLAFFWYWSYCYVTRKLDETCWICRHWITRIPREQTTKARQTYRQLPFEN